MRGGALRGAARAKVLRKEYLPEPCGEGTRARHTDLWGLRAVGRPRRDSEGVRTMTGSRGGQTGLDAYPFNGTVLRGSCTVSRLRHHLPGQF